MSDAGVIDVGCLRIDRRARSVTVGGTPVHLTAAEYSILDDLCRCAGTVRSRSDLMLVIGHADPSPLDRALDVHVSNLRRKLGHSGKRIVTVRGAGYLVTLADPH